MADALGDVLRFMEVAGGTAESLVKLFNTKVEVEASTAALAIDKARTDFLIRYELPANDPRRLDPENWEADLAGLQATIDDGMAGIKDQAVRGAVMSMYQGSNNKFRLDMARAMASATRKKIIEGVGMMADFVVANGSIPDADKLGMVADMYNGEEMAEAIPSDEYGMATRKALIAEKTKGVAASAIISAASASVKSADELLVAVDTVPVVGSSGDAVPVTDSARTAAKALVAASIEKSNKALLDLAKSPQFSEGIDYDKSAGILKASPYWKSSSSGAQKLAVMELDTAYDGNLLAYARTMKTALLGGLGEQDLDQDVYQGIVDTLTEVSGGARTSIGKNDILKLLDGIQVRKESDGLTEADKKNRANQDYVKLIYALDSGQMDAATALSRCLEGGGTNIWEYEPTLYLKMREHIMSGNHLDEITIGSLESVWGGAAAQPFLARVGLMVKDEAAYSKEDRKYTEAAMAAISSKKRSARESLVADGVVGYVNDFIRVRVAGGKKMSEDEIQSLAAKAFITASSLVRYENLQPNVKYTFDSEATLKKNVYSWQMATDKGTYSGLLTADVYGNPPSLPWLWGVLTQQKTLAEGMFAQIDPDSDLAKRIGFKGGSPSSMLHGTVDAGDPYFTTSARSGNAQTSVTTAYTVRFDASPDRQNEFQWSVYKGNEYIGPLPIKASAPRQNPPIPAIIESTTQTGWEG